MQKVRWGLVSTANINRRLIPAIRASKRGELVAVASRSPNRAEEYAREWEIPQAFGNYREMLESGEIDAVYVGLPNHLHAEWSIRAMEQGLHVLCEKPFALTLHEVDAMFNTARAAGVVLAEAFMYRHHPQMKLVGKWVEDGRLGEITVVRGAFNFSMDDPENVRMIPEWGGGCLWDVGVYPLSFAQYIFGEPPAAVFGAQWVGETGVDETFVGQMRYTGNRFAQITSAFRSPFYTMAEVIGTKGRLWLDRPFVGVEGKSAVIFFSADGEPEELEVPEKELYLGEVEDMHAAILEGKPNYLSPTETRNHVRTVLALYESARTEQVVHL